MTKGGTMTKGAAMTKEESLKMKEESAQKARYIRLLAANYGAELDEDTTTLWLVLLAPYSAEQCRNAVLSVVRTCGYEAVRFGSLPPFALIQRALDAGTGVVRGERNTRLMAEAEWGKLLEAVGVSGIWREPQLHPTTAFVVRQMGGWKRVCRWKEEELGWKHREFLGLWCESSGREEVLLLGARAVARLEEGPQSVAAVLEGGGALPPGRKDAGTAEERRPGAETPDRGALPAARKDEARMRNTTCTRRIPGRVRAHEEGVC